MKEIKTKKPSKYIYWWHEEYLFKLPIPYWNYCDECGHRRLKWYEKGFVVLRRTRRRRLRTAWDTMVDFYADLLIRKTIRAGNSLFYTTEAERYRVLPKRKGSKIKFRRYGKLVN